MTIETVAVMYRIPYSKLTDAPHSKDAKSITFSYGITEAEFCIRGKRELLLWKHSKNARSKGVYRYIQIFRNIIMVPLAIVAIQNSNNL